MDKEIMRFFRLMMLLTSIMIAIGLWFTEFDSDTIARAFPLYLMTVVFEVWSFIAEK